MNEFGIKEGINIKKEVEPKHILSYEKEIFDTREEFERKYLRDKYGKLDEITNHVSQGSLKFYNGMPLESGAFVQCVGVILESERAMCLTHVDPMGMWQSNIPKVRKYFEGEKTNLTILKGSKARADAEIVPTFKEIKVNTEGINIIDVPSGDGRWGTIFYPSKEGNEIITHYYLDDKKYVAEKYNIGKGIYDDDKNKKSQEFFESRDYMPKGFRKVQ